MLVKLDYNVAIDASMVVCVTESKKGIDRCYWVTHVRLSDGTTVTVTKRASEVLEKLGVK